MSPAWSFPRDAGRHALSCARSFVCPLVYANDVCKSVCADWLVPIGASCRGLRLCCEAGRWQRGRCGRPKRVLAGPPRRLLTQLRASTVVRVITRVRPPLRLTPPGRRVPISPATSSVGRPVSARGRTSGIRRVWAQTPHPPYSECPHLSAGGGGLASTLS